MINGLRTFYAEINKRDYQNILGLKAEIKQDDYMRMLEILPPKNFNGNSFCMSEFLTGPLTTRFWKENGKYYAEVVDYRDVKKDGANYGFVDEWDACDERAKALQEADLRMDESMKRRGLNGGTVSKADG